VADTLPEDEIRYPARMRTMLWPILAAIVAACSGGTPPDDAGVGVVCGSATCAVGEMCCSPGCNEMGDPIEVCDDDCAFTPTGPVFECR